MIAIKKADNDELHLLIKDKNYNECKVKYNADMFLHAIPKVVVNTTPLYRYRANGQISERLVELYVNHYYELMHEENLYNFTLFQTYTLILILPQRY